MANGGIPSTPSSESYADRIHDPDLTEFGRWQAWRVGRRFAENGVAFDAVYASPFLRAVQTADEICREINRTVRLEPGLGEHRNPEWFDSDPETASYDDLADWFDTVRLDHDPVVIPEFPEHHEEAERRAGRPPGDSSRRRERTGQTPETCFWLVMA
ncbi:histidine phosphatase family protein [Natronoarchaeum sp. GCM10025703]|uniref:histidine phosphatase family protein n=1 Tax=Natronoarchaeum sp. GCM10025703 TaxID=3252685 RepID=UPI0036214AF7